MVLLNKNGSAIFQTPTDPNANNDYVGCYRDKPQRAMNFAKGKGNYAYDYDSCGDFARTNGYEYFYRNAQKKPESHGSD